MTILKNIISTLFCLAMVALGLFIIMKIGGHYFPQVDMLRTINEYNPLSNLISIINGILCDLQTQRLK